MGPEGLGRREDDQELAGQIEGSIEHRAGGRIRGLDVVCSEGQIVHPGRSRADHAGRLAQPAGPDRTDGRPRLTSQFVVC
jgi:hypothetical protein